MALSLLNKYAQLKMMKSARAGRDLSPIRTFVRTGRDLSKFIQKS